MTTLDDNTADTPPLKRHPALQPLSREHFNGLRLARRLTQAAELDLARRIGVIAEFERAWDDEIDAHFDDEERLLTGLVTPEDAARLRDEHARLRALLQTLASTRSNPEPATLRRFGQLLHDHIRWEERSLFQRVQESASDEQLASLVEAMRLVEAERPGSRRRGA